MHKYVVYQDSKQEWRWTFYAENGEALAVSSEGYRDESDCYRGVEIVQNFGGQAHAIVVSGEQPVAVTPTEKPKRKRTTKRK